MVVATVAVAAAPTTFDFRSFDEGHHLAAYSVGAEYEFKPTESSGVVLGYGQSWLDAEGGKTDTEGMFLVGGFLDFPTGTRLRGSVARKIRFPSLRQLYEIDTGNPGLEAERSYGFEVGVEQELPGQTLLALTGFQTELYGFIERISGQPFENRERLRMRGFELTAASRPWEPLFLRFGYTFLDARDIADDSPFDELQSRPRHKIDAEVALHAPMGYGGDGLG